MLALPKYEQLKDKFPTDVTSAHNGYFSQDKKGVFKDTKGNTLADDDTYNTIMKDKEWLLSFECPLRFIWSHSALKEGWDNTNVFQVCTLIEQKSTLTCRQKIGRGLRLCVNQNGERIEDKNINVLHVIANESFAEFADTLQREIEQETGIKFGILEIGMFSGMTYQETKIVEKRVTEEQAKKVVEVLKISGIIKDNGKVENAELIHKIELPKELEPVKETLKNIIEKTDIVDKEVLKDSAYEEKIIEEKTLTYDDATELMYYFEKKDYITKTGKIKDTMKNALSNGMLDVPEKFEGAKERLENIIIQANNKLPIRNSSKEVTVKLKKQVILSPEFQQLWNKIKQKTKYQLQVDPEKLVNQCIKDLKELPPVPKARVVTQSADIHIESSGVTHTEKGIRTTNLKTEYPELPDILDIVSEECYILPSDVYKMLMESGRSIDFLNNPQAFLERFLQIVHNNLNGMITDGIKYIKVEGKEYYVQEIFNMDELKANLDKDAVAVKNSLYDYVIYDSSTVEKPFAVALDNDPDVKLFFKLPAKFKVDTPVGGYNPDWAIYMDKDGQEKLYFIVETKGSTNFMQLRTQEQLKIKCGKEHFKALENDTSLFVAKDWNLLKKESIN